MDSSTIMDIYSILRSMEYHRYHHIVYDMQYNRVHSSTMVAFDNVLFGGSLYNMFP